MSNIEDGADSYTKLEPWQALYIAYNKIYLPNSATLLSDLNRPNQDPKFLMGIIKSFDELRSYTYLILRDLHSYLASFSTIVDLSRSLAKVYDKEKIIEYERNKDMVVESKVNHFIKDLRNYLMHSSVPMTSTTLSWHRDSGSQHDVCLDKENLLTWSGWDGKSKEFINEKGSIKLQDTVAEHIQMIEKLFTILLTKEMYWETIKDSNQIVKGMLEKNK